MSDVTFSDQSMFAILRACNGAMMESAVLGNTIAQKTNETLNNMKPLYKDMEKQADRIGEMAKIMYVVQIISIIAAPLAVIGAGIGATGLISAEVAGAVINATVDTAQAVASTLQGAVAIGNSQSQAALSLDQSKTDNISRQSRLLYNALKDESTVKQAIAQGTADTISKNAQADVAYKAH